MKAREYEQYVAGLVQELDCFKTGTTYTNRRFPGVRQPGEYEIDVAVEIVLGQVVSFLLIIECKNWKRPVDRPVVQKLTQTRDAIAAQKAAVVSPIGFSQEAIDVARVHGIALWVIAEGSWDIIMGLMGPPRWSREYESLRLGFLESLGFDPPEHPKSAIVQFSALSSRLRSEILPSAISDRATLQIDMPSSQFTYSCVGGSAVTRHVCTPGVDERTALTEIANAMFAHMNQSFELDDSGIVRGVKDWLAHTEQYLSGLGLDKERAVRATQAVTMNDREAFRLASEPIFPKRF